MTRIPTSVLRQRCTLEPFRGEKSLGGAAYGPPVEMRCRFDSRRRVVRRADGTEQIAEGTVIVRPFNQLDEDAPDTPIDYPTAWPPESRVTLGTTAYRLVGVNVAQGLNRPSHLELMVAP